MMEDNIDEAEEETLSLFEYSINSTATIAAAESEWEDYYSTSIIKHDEQQQQHYFEFCSDEWASNYGPEEKIIFCGKIISHQEPTSGNAQKSQPINEKRQKKPADMFHWKSEIKDSGGKFSVQKMSIVASPRKFRWYLLFWKTRYPMEMALRDMKNRQSRRIPSSPLFRLEGAEKNKVNSSKGRGGQGLWGKIRRWFLTK